MVASEDLEPLKPRVESDDQALITLHPETYLSNETPTDPNLCAKILHASRSLRSYRRF